MLAVAFLMRSSTGERVLMMVTLVGLFGTLLIRSPRIALGGLVIYVSIIGGMRRWLIPDFGWVGTDPLQLVWPILLGLYFANLLITRLLPRDTKLSRLLLWMLSIMALEVVNPLQGGLIIGLAGILFYIVPILWYYYGRRYGDSATLQLVFRLTIGISLVASLYGLYQTWFGFNTGEQAWLKMVATTYTALNAGGGVIRAFSFFPSPAEYVLFLTMGAVLLWGEFLGGRRLAIVPMAFLLFSIFFASSRGAVVGTLFACVIMAAIQGRSVHSWIPRLTVAVAIAVFGLVWSLQQVQQVHFSAQSQALVTHQTAGLLDPENSTAPGHATRLFNGVLTGFTHPLGDGLGSTTLAAAKFGGDAVGTEVDYSDIFVALGLLGGPLYLFIFGYTIFLAFRHWHQSRSLVSLQIVGLLVVNQGHWLLGGYYSLTMLTWFTIGALDRAHRKTAP